MKLNEPNSFPLTLDLQFFAEGGDPYDQIDYEQLGGIVEDSERPPIDEIVDPPEPPETLPPDSDIDPQPPEEDPQTTQTQPELYTYKADGMEKQATLDELLTLAAAGDNYTRKTQELSTTVEQKVQERLVEIEATKQAEVEQAVQAARQEYDNSLGARMEKILEINPDLQRIISAEMKQFFDEDPIALQRTNALFAQQQAQQAPQVPQPPQAPSITETPEYIALQEQLHAQNERLEQIALERQVEEARNEWTQLVKQYPDAEKHRVEIAQLADEKGINLSLAYRDYMFDKIAQTKEEDLARQALHRQQARITTPTKQKGLDEPKKITSYDDAWKQAMADGFNPFN